VASLLISEEEQCTANIMAALIRKVRKVRVIFDMKFKECVVMGLDMWFENECTCNECQRSAQNFGFF
jgi:hypothetical protein